MRLQIEIFIEALCLWIGDGMVDQETCTAVTAPIALLCFLRSETDVVTFPDYNERDRGFVTSP